MTLSLPVRAFSVADPRQPDARCRAAVGGGYSKDVPHFNPDF
jgi:hypothetical protein